MEFRILGPLEARDDGVALALGGAKQRALLAVFLLHANEVVSTERLIDALWEEPPVKAAKAVQVYVSRLRKALGGTTLTSRPPGYILELEPDRLDLLRFSRLVEEARREPADAADKLAEALNLWRGQPLAEFASEPFARVERVRLEELHLEALAQRIEAELALGRHASVVGELEALVAAEPMRERPRGQLMLALYRCGRQAEALAVYREGRRALVEELGMEPSRQLQELEQAILRHDPELELVEPRSRAAATTAPAREAAPEAPPTEERKVVSVLFVDLVGLVAHSHAADPEDARAALRPFHAAAKREIERYGGTIERLLGDEVVALFGAPVVHEDDAQRAVRAALALRRWIRTEGDDLRVRMAVSTGEALIAVGSGPLAGEPTASGDVVITARDLRTAAPIDGILVGEQTYRATREAIEYRQPDPAEVGGEPVLLRVWEALEARAPVGVDLVREPRTPLVGRRRELDLLVSALARVREERSPQLVTLVGVPGIGKSRLVLELSKAVDQDPDLISWRQGRCLPYGEGVSYWALGGVVKAQAGILESDTPEQAEKKLRRAVHDVIGTTDEASWIQQQLQPLVGAGGELGPGGRSGEAFAAWRLFLAGLADLRPLVLVLEDLHWADEGLLEFVDELADRIRNAPLLILCTTRPELLERRPGWGGGKANALTISLPPLSDEETERIVAAVLKRPVLAPKESRTLLSQSAGNPLYAEQFARMLAELGRLEELPDTVHGIIAARLDGLLPQEKALLQDAAVVGKVFWAGALEALGHGPRREAEELLFGLERKEFVQPVRRSAVARDAEYTFRHVLLRDVAYGQIPRAARGEKHRRAAVWIESLGRPEDHAEMLAHHYLSAIEYASAAGGEDHAVAESARLALRAAGDRTLALASYAAAARFYEAALELWPESDPDRVWLLVHAGRAKHAADGSGIDLLERGFDELRSRGDADGAAEVAVELARCHVFAGDRDAAYAYIERALELTEGRTATRARVHALVARAGYHKVASEHPQAIRMAREALGLAEDLRLDDLRVRALDVLGSARALSGDVGGLDDSQCAVTLARTSNAFFYLLYAVGNLFISQVSLARLDASSETLDTFRRDMERYGTAVFRPWLRSYEAFGWVVHGQWDDAICALDALIAEVEAGASHYEEASWRAQRAWIAFARDDFERASAGSEEALARARTIEDPQLLTPALALRGTVLLAEGRQEQASSLASEALRLGSVPLGALLEHIPVATPVEFAWLLRDLGRETDLLSALGSSPSTPWLDAARAIAHGDFAQSVDFVARIRAPSVEAYARLRTAEELARSGRHVEARECLAPATAFFTRVGATRYLRQAEELLAAST